MAFPASVSQLASTRKRVRQPRVPLPRTSRNEWEDVEDEPGGLGVGPGGPLLDFGRDGGVKLVLEKGLWRWRWATEAHPEIKLVVGTESRVLFPPTRRRFPSQDDLSIDEKVRSAREYLSILLRQDDDEEAGVGDVVEKVLRLSSGETDRGADPYQGRVMAVIHNSRATVARTLLCFAAGSVGSHLNISPFLPSSNAQALSTGISKFVPIARPAIRFPTEILQICSSPIISSNRLDRDATALVVRLHSTTSLLNVVPSHTYMPPTEAEPHYTQEIAQLHISQTGNRRHVDAALDPHSWSRALIVDECGGVWLWYEDKVQIAERLQKHVQVRQIRQPVTKLRDQFFRVAFGTRPGTAIVMSRRSITVLDIEQDTPATLLIELHGRGRVFTDLEKTVAERGATYTIACTTSEVMWIDQLKGGAPVLSWSHDYGSGSIKDLTLILIKRRGIECVLLSSPSDALIMVFHVPSDPPIRSLLSPYCLAVPSSNHNSPLTSLAYIALQHNNTGKVSQTLLLGLSSNGSVIALPIDLDKNNEREPAVSSGRRSRRFHFKVQWSEDVTALSTPKDESSRRPSDDDLIAETVYRTMSCRWAWLEINDEPPYEAQGFLSVSDFEQHLRELDAPFEHLMTAGDLVRDLFNGEWTKTRSNLLAPLPGVKRDTVSDFIRLDMSRHLPVVTRLEPDATLTELEIEYPAISKTTEMSAPMRARHEDNLIKLATNLILSRTVLSSEMLTGTSKSSQAATFERAETPDELFARATGQLSLNDQQPRSVEFTYLSPKPKADCEGDNQTPNSTEPLDALENATVRAMLDEWSVGSDPKEYDWKPWRGDLIHDSTTPYLRPIRPLPSPRPSPTRVAGTQPPLLRPAISVQTIMSFSPPMARSSPPPMMPSSSGVEMVMQTQVERGPFGGRTGGVGGGNKKVKKRIGGF